MKQEKLIMNKIPALLIGEPSEKVFLVVHGKCGNKEEAIGFAEKVCKQGWQVLSIDLPGHGERKEEMEGFVPWKVVPELQIIMNELQKKWTTVALRAGSIGAWFSMLAFMDQPEKIEKAIFSSPIVDMEKLICDMMIWANVTEEQLKKEGKIETSFGETLHWEYLCYVREHPITWSVPTRILYAAKDHLMSRETMVNFAKDNQIDLTIYEEGEHWFHTPEQLEVLDKWEKESI